MKIQSTTTFTAVGLHEMLLFSSIFIANTVNVYLLITVNTLVLIKLVLDSEWVYKQKTVFNARN